MLVEIAIGDAYGAGFEFSQREKIIALNSGKKYVQHELGIPAGHYTDDTQMSIAIAEILLSSGHFTKPECANSFVTSFKRDPRQGYAKRFQSLLEACQSGADLLQLIKPESRRNGAAMRSVPLGLIADKEELLVAAQTQASVTHDTPEGVISSQIVSLASHYLIYHQMPLAELPMTLQKETGFSIQENWSSEVECDAIQTIHAVFTALLRNTRLSELIIDCVNYGGDVDSVAAIALGLASLSTEYLHDIPESLFLTLEQGSYGLEFLKNLDTDLQQKYPELPIFY